MQSVRSVTRASKPRGAMVNGLLLFVVAVTRLVVNLVAMRLLRAGAGENLNVKGAYLGVWSDMLGSVAVIVAALVIKPAGWTIVDPLLAVQIAPWVLPRTWTPQLETRHCGQHGCEPDEHDHAAGGRHA